MYCGSGGIDPCFLDLGTSWRWAVSFTTRPLYTWGNSPLYPLDRRLCGPQSRSGQHGEMTLVYPPISQWMHSNSSTPYNRMNGKGSGRKRQWSSQGTLPEFSLEWLMNITSNLRITGVLAKVRTKHLPDTSLELHHHANTVSVCLCMLQRLLKYSNIDFSIGKNVTTCCFRRA
jgi:hypothetical protein